MGKEFKTTLETHDLPTRIEVIDRPSGIYNINYETLDDYHNKKDEEEADNE